MRNIQHNHGGRPQSESCKQESLTNAAAPHTGRGTKQSIMKTHSININTALTRLGIFVLLLFAVQAHAQTIANSTGKLVASNKNINVVYTVSAKGDMATFTLTNSGGTALKSGDRFTIELPAISGYRYDLTNLQKSNGFGSTPFGFQMVITGYYKNGDVLSFHCPVVAVTTKLTSSPTLQFVKK